MVKKPFLSAFGAAHLDRIARLESAPAPTSVPATVHTFAGGAAFNVARQFVRAGGAATLWTPGNAHDLAAGAAGVLLRSIPSTVDAPPSYTAIVDPDGELVVAASDMRRYDELPALGDTIEYGNHVLLDANLSTSALRSIVSRCPAEARLYAMAVSPAKIDRLMELPRRLDVLFANVHEIAALGLDPERPPNFCRAAVITDGARRLVHVDERSRTVHDVDAIRPVDVTGAGDAVAGAFLRATIAGASKSDALRLASEAARETILGEGPYPFLRTTPC